jgi:SAM-dependent methyltransferase
MTNRSADEIRSAVSAAYGARAREAAQGSDAGCCGDGCCSDSSPATGARTRYYDAVETADLPETVVSYGCGNPTAIAGLRPGEVVLDLGSGAGLDCFLSARQVGLAGHVIGLDMTDDMLALAEQNRARLGVTNVEFRKGTMEAIPVGDASVDVIISNCVINLSPDKGAVFREAFRVLRPGGRLHVSDVVLLHALSAAEQADLDLWAGCVSGALPVDGYAAGLRAAGFEDVTITETEVVADGAPDRPWRNALINSRRPGGSAPPRPWQQPGAETIVLMAPPGLETAACCGPGAPSDVRCC